jgi:hemerythrin-like metal-binding protein
MKWNDALLTEIDEIDRQHRSLFDCLTRLEDAHEKQQGWSQIHFAIIELKNYIKEHFTVEEALLRLCQYPLLEPHIAEHRDFEKNVLRIEKESLGEDVAREMIVFLRHWLVEHISKTDHQYVPFLKNTRVPFSSR